LYNIFNGREHGTQAEADKLFSQIGNHPFFLTTITGSSGEIHQYITGMERNNGYPGGRLNSRRER
jgi:hypothetical protein